jgi:hypothetical protein
MLARLFTCSLQKFAPVAIALGHGTFLGRYWWNTITDQQDIEHWLATKVQLSPNDNKTEVSRAFVY